MCPTGPKGCQVHEIHFAAIFRDYLSRLSFAIIFRDYLSRSP